MSLQLNMTPVPHVPVDGKWCMVNGKQRKVNVNKCGAKKSAAGFYASSALSLLRRQKFI
jgi:hypothetical protein